MTKIIAIAFLLLVACSPKEESEDKNSQTMVTSTAPAGEYNLDKTHASLLFKVNHLGLSHYTARFKKFDAKLQFDPQNPAKSSIVAIIDPTSIETDFPNLEPNFNEELQGEAWLDTLKFPQIKFSSTAIEMTGKYSAKVIGELSLRGITKSVTMDVVFNSGYDSIPMDTTTSRVGFSAKGSLKRSDFGIIFGIPQDGSNLGVSDLVEFVIEVEFNKKKQ